jgi:putative peptidoglycan lipid II flippase
LSKQPSEYPSDESTNSSERNGRVDGTGTSHGNGSIDKPVPPSVSIAQESEHSPEAAVLDYDTATAVQTPETGRRVAKATAGIGVLHVLRLLIGIVAQPLIANRVGLTSFADVYAVATDIVTSIWRIFEKAVNPTFLPCFMHALGDEGEKRAWRYASTALWLTTLVLLVMSPLAWWGMPWIVDLYSLKASPEQRVMTVAIARLLLSGLVFLGISSLTYVILNGYKRFAWAAFGDAMWKVGVLAGAGWAVTQKLEPLPALYAISWGFVIGSILKLLPHLVALGSKWRLFKPRIDWRDPLLRKMLILAVPLLLGIFVSETRDIFLKRLADSPNIDVAGSRAALRFSSLISSSLIQIFPYALSIGIFPYLADMARQRDRQPLTDTLVGALRVCVFIFGPLTAILIALHGPLLRAVWESGELDRADTLVMALPFIAYTMGLIGFSCEMMLNQTFYAMTNVWTPTAIGLGTTVMWIGVATLGVMNGWGLAAIAGAEAFSKSVKCLVMWFMLRRDLGNVHARDNLVFFLKVLAGSLLAAAVAWTVVQGLAPSGEVLTKIDKIKILLAVSGAGLSGVVIYIALGAVAGVQEVRSIFSFVGKVRKRFARR